LWLARLAEGDQVLLGLLEELGHLGDARGQALDHRGGSLAGLLVALGGKTSRSAAETMPRWAGRQCWWMSRTKCPVQRCQGQPSTRAIAALRPSWASEAQCGLG
jgi:hypothetical protein